MELKKIIQYTFQKIFGIENYLFCFGYYRAILKCIYPGGQLSMFIKLAQKKEGDVLDIGANVATYSICFAKKMPQKQIVSFEPVLILSKICKRLIDVFSVQNCIIRNEAIGEKNEQLELLTPYDQGVFMHGLTFIHDEHSFYNINDFVANAQMVNVFSLDHYYTNSKQRKIAVIKIDVENYELFVIKGATKVLTEQRPFVFMELWDNERKPMCELAMEQLSYTQMVVRKGKLEPVGTDMASDYFFIPNECVESVNL